MSWPELKPCPFCGGEWRRGPYDVHCYGTEFNRHTMVVLRYDEANLRTPDPTQIRADAIREALALPRYEPDFTENLGDRSEMKPDPHGDWISAAAILALLDTPLSPSAVDGSPAPDAGGKEGV